LDVMDRNILSNVYNYA